ncbi:MAG: SAM-dependent chlorinase/fluorinase [Bacillota bacterium]
MLMQTKPIVLLTDFGWSSYVGAMKGVILSRCPYAQIVDLTHDVAPQNVREGAWLLLVNYLYFPPGSIFLAVVDPGVGTKRKALAIKTKDYYFLGPDNGLLSPAAARAGIVDTVELAVPPEASLTFHGRDVFAPAVAKLAAGLPFRELGKPVVPEVNFAFYLNGREGEVVTIDRFGNVITNIPPLPNRRKYAVSLARGGKSYFRSELPFCPAYAFAPEGVLFLITGSGGTLEISVKNGSAASRLGVEVADRVAIT